MGRIRERQSPVRQVGLQVAPDAIEQLKFVIGGGLIALLRILRAAIGCRFVAMAGSSFRRSIFVIFMNASSTPPLALVGDAARPYAFFTGRAPKAVHAAGILDTSWQYDCRTTPTLR